MTDEEVKKIITKYEKMVEYLAIRLEGWTAPMETKEDLIKKARETAER